MAAAVACSLYLTVSPGKRAVAGHCVVRANSKPSLGVDKLKALRNYRDHLCRCCCHRRTPPNPQRDRNLTMKSRMKLGAGAATLLALAGMTNNAWANSDAQSFQQLAAVTNNGQPTYTYSLIFTLVNPSDGVVFLVSAAPIPEPETHALMLLGLGAVGWAARRRNGARR